jgi:hypothetical protein
MHAYPSSSGRIHIIMLYIQDLPFEGKPHYPIKKSDELVTLPDGKMPKKCNGRFNGNDHWLGVTQTCIKKG